MKQKDIALIIVVVFLSGMVSFFISGKLITPPKNRKEKVEVVEPISSQFNPPDKKYFNAQSLNPTQLITIGQDVNNTPFNKPN